MTAGLGRPSRIGSRESVPAGGAHRRGAPHKAGTEGNINTGRATTTLYIKKFCVKEEVSNIYKPELIVNLRTVVQVGLA